MAWIGLGLLAAAGAAGVAIFGRIGLQQVDSVRATALRSSVRSAALVAVAIGSGRFGALIEAPRLVGSRAGLCVIAAGICGAGSWLAYFAALRVANAGPVAALDRLSLPLVLVLGVVVLGEDVGWRGWLGLALAVAGTALITWDPIARSV